MTTKAPSLAKAAALSTFLMCLSAGFANAQNVFLDFGQTLTPSNSTTYWNNYPTNTFLNLANSQGTATAYFFTPNVGGGINTNFITGSPNLTNLGVFNDPTVYSDAINTGTSCSYYFYNVNTNLTYDFTLFGSRTATETRTTLYTMAGSTTASNSVTTSGSNIGGTGTNYNSSSLVNLTGLRSTNYGGGIGNGFLLTISVQTGAFAYLNAMQAYGYLGYLGGGTFDLNTNAPYVQVATNADGAVSADTVIGGGSTVNVGSASGIYYNSTVVMTNGGGTINRNTNFTIHALNGAANLALGGSGNLSISRAGTYSGTLTMTGGTLTVNGNNALGTGNLVLNGGTLAVNAAQGLGTGTITVASGTTTLNNTGSSLDALTGNNNFVLQGGTFTVNGGGKILNLGTGNVSVSGFNNLNAFNGGMQFNGTISGTGTLNWFGGGSLVLGGSNTFSGTVSVNANGGSLVLSNVNALQSATLNKGTNQTVAFALAGANTYNLGGLTGAGDIALTNGNSLNIKVSGNNTYSGILSGNGALTKSGNGTLTLSGANTHSGGTTVSAGILLVNSISGSGTGTGTLNVESGATLGGNGIVGGPAVIAGLHSPGNSPGIQTFTNGLNYVSGSSFIWELNSNTSAGRGTNFDGVNITGGTLTINTGVTNNLVFNAVGSSVLWSDAFWSTNQTWLVFSNATTPSFASASIFDAVNVSLDSIGNDLASSRSGAGFAWNTVGNDLYLSYTVPEPSTYAILGFAALILAAKEVRRRHRSGNKAGESRRS